MNNIEDRLKIKNEIAKSITIKLNEDINQFFKEVIKGVITNGYITRRAMFSILRDNDKEYQTAKRAGDIIYTTIFDNQVVERFVEGFVHPFVHDFVYSNGPNVTGLLSEGTIEGRICFAVNSENPLYKNVVSDYNSEGKTIRFEALKKFFTPEEQAMLVSEIN